MPIRTKTLGSNGDNEVKLDVTIEGMKITVGAGPFRFGGEDFVLDDDYEYTVAESSDPRTLVVVLAKETASGDGVVVVDEEGPDDGRFPWDGSGYEPMTRLFFGTIPADTTDLNDVSWVKLAVEVPPEPEAPEEPTEGRQAPDAGDAPDIPVRQPLVDEEE